MDKKEINRLIAEKVMGWEWIRDEVNQCSVWKTDDGYISSFQPSERIDDAWLAVEKFFSYEITKLENRCGYEIVIWNEFSFSVMSHAETAPLAISLVALKAVGIEVTK